MGRLNGQCGASLACKSTTCRVIGSLCFEEGSGGGQDQWERMIHPVTRIPGAPFK